MKVKPIIILVILVILMILYWVNRDNDKKDIKRVPELKNTSTRTKGDEGANRTELRRSTHNIIITKHAKCRMNCREITLSEVKQIIEEGEINQSKSEFDDTPEFALEGYTNDKQYVRVVVAQQEDKLVLITCIDLKKDWPCNCK